MKIEIKDLDRRKREIREGREALRALDPLRDELQHRDGLQRERRAADALRHLPEPQRPLWHRGRAVSECESRERKNLTTGPFWDDRRSDDHARSVVKDRG